MDKLYFVNAVRYGPYTNDRIFVRTKQEAERVARALVKTEVYVGCEIFEPSGKQVKVYGLLEKQ